VAPARLVAPVQRQVGQVLSGAQVLLAEPDQLQAAALAAALVGQLVVALVEPAEALAAVQVARAAAPVEPSS
jgi:hypothetical protein